jgi:drug/metabolite transporter (DMT)-like permease
MNANLLALGAIALWASLAALGVALSHVPPLLLTGLSLLVGSLIALPLSRFDLRQWRVPASTLALGVYGLFGFHFLLFIALRHAPPVQANLVNYLWPLGIVVMAPLFLPGVTLTVHDGDEEFHPAVPVSRSRRRSKPVCSWTFSLMGVKPYLA